MALEATAFGFWMQIGCLLNRQELEPAFKAILLDHFKRNTNHMTASDRSKNKGRGERDILHHIPLGALSLCFHVS